MELTLIKYAIFIVVSIVLTGGLSLWLKSNRNKRNSDFEAAKRGEISSEDRLEIQKALHRKAVEENKAKNNS